MDIDTIPTRQIAQLIEDDWSPKVSPHARPYLDAMFSLENISDHYYLDSGLDIVTYFLSNARSWRGDQARKIKAELNRRLKEARH